MGNVQQINAQPESWLRRVAILLSSLPASTAAELVQTLDADLQSRVQAAVESLTNVDRNERDQILRQFRNQMLARETVPTTKSSTPQEQFEDEFEIGRDVKDESRSPQVTSLLNRQVASVVSQWQLPRSFTAKPFSENAFAFLDDVNDDDMVKLLSCEHPQTIALVFASITPKQAARVLPRLAPEIQSETVRRIGRLDNVPEATSEEVATQLRQRVHELNTIEINSGQQALQAIVEAMPHEFATDEHQFPATDADRFLVQTTDLWVDSFEPGQDEVTIPIDTPDVASPSAEEVQQYLLQLPRTDLCAALGGVQTRDALLTLCGLPSEVAEQALSILPRAQAKQVRRDMANFGPLQLREIDEAKQRVARAAQEIAEHSSAPIAA